MCRSGAPKVVSGSTPRNTRKGNSNASRAAACSSSYARTSSDRAWDGGTSPGERAWSVATYSQLRWGELDGLGCVAAKPISQGGIRGRVEATGRGVFYGVREVVSLAEDMKPLGLSPGIDGKRV